MNRVLRPQPLSLVLGLVLGAICLLSMSQVWPAGQRVIVGYGPHPRDMVQMREGTPFTVPPGRLLVVTSLGAAANLSSITSLLVDGQSALQVKPEIGAGGASTDVSTMKSVPTGFTVSAGAVVSVYVNGPSANDGRAWGYLAPQ